VNSSFFEQVYAVVASIPAGSVVSYGQIALHLGAPRAARTVGWAMSSCSGDLPWHRIVNAQGKISAPVDSERFVMQCDRLRAEGIVVSADGCIDLKRYGWNGI
jgi:methylated-DNA-protein-cysteine methyltransferase related protein